MADTEGKTVSNQFRVTSLEAFQTWIDGYDLGHAGAGDRGGRGPERERRGVHRRRTDQYPQPWPKWRLLPEGAPEEDEEPVEWRTWAGDLAGAPGPPDTVAHFIAFGAEKLRSGEYTEMAVTPLAPEACGRRRRRSRAPRRCSSATRAPITQQGLLKERLQALLEAAWRCRQAHGRGAAQGPPARQPVRPQSRDWEAERKACLAATCATSGRGWLPLERRREGPE